MVLQTLKEQADEDAIDVFGKNLHELLMAAPSRPAGHDRDRPWISHGMQNRSRLMGRESSLPTTAIFSHATEERY